MTAQDIIFRRFIATAFKNPSKVRALLPHIPQSLLSKESKFPEKFLLGLLVDQYRNSNNILDKVAMLNEIDSIHTGDSKERELLEEIINSADNLSPEQMDYAVEDMQKKCIRDYAVNTHTIEAETLYQEDTVIDAEKILKKLRRMAYEIEIMSQEDENDEEDLIPEDYYDRLINNPPRASVVKCGHASLDELMGGGLAAGELGIFVSTSNAGKTWVLCDFAIKAALSGKSVLYVTLEMSKEDIWSRFITLMTKMYLPSQKNNPEAVEEAKIKIRKYLRVKHRSNNTYYPDMIEGMLQRLIDKDKPVDLVIVDQADNLLSPGETRNNRNVSSYESKGLIYSELRRIATEKKVPMWTSCQSNRSGYGKADKGINISAENMSESMQKLFTSDLVLIMTPKERIAEIQKGTLWIDKNRAGASKRELFINIDYNDKCVGVTITDDNQVKAPMQNKLNAALQKSKTTGFEKE